MISTNVAAASTPSEEVLLMNMETSLRRNSATVRGAILWLALVLVAAAMGTGLFAPRTTSADLYAYRLIGGPFNRYVYISVSVSPQSWWVGRAQWAIHYWNFAQTSTGSYVVAFYETTNWNISALDYYVDDYGD